MATLKEQYLQATKTEKGNILNEYCKNTKQDRKYVIKKFRGKTKAKDEKLPRKARTEKYDGLVKATLAEIWMIFDTPCGQRLKPLIKTELSKLRKLEEIVCSDLVASKLLQISTAEIDRSLKHEKEVLRLNEKYSKKRNMLLCSHVPVKTSAELKKDTPGIMQIDCVESCGTNASGNYVNSLSTVDIFSGWWEGDAMMGKGQGVALVAIDEARKRSPFGWKEMHPDNGGNIMNYSVYKYAEENEIEFTRSRPYKKNDNCFIEQKNSTHVRNVIGYLRYDTEEEREIISDLYQNELRLYKNFFQPVMKISKKERINGKIHKRYDEAKTPYARLMESDKVSETQKAELLKTYECLNPADLKRKIDVKLKELFRAYQKKNGTLVEARRDVTKKILPSTVSFSKTR